MAKFSIIVPIYNAEAFVTETLENLLKQEVDKEILLINDGSTDNSEQIIREYARRNDCIKAFNKENGGCASARNFGLNVATGDYIVYCDSDDLLEDGLLKRCEKIYAENNIEAIFYSYKYCFLNGKSDIIFDYKPTGLYSTKDWFDDYYKLSSLHIIHCIGTTIYKKEIIDKYDLRFNDKVTYNEEIGFCSRYLGYVKTLYYINEPVYHYRVINPQSLIAVYKKDFSYANDYMFNELRFMFGKIYGEDTIPEEIMYKVFADGIYIAVSNVLNRRDAPSEQIQSEIIHCRECIYLDKCIEHASTKHKKRVLKALKLTDIEECKHVIRKYFIQDRICNSLIKPLRKIRRVINKFI